MAFILLLLGIAAGEAQVMWNLKGTGMYRKSYYDWSSDGDNYHKNTFDWGAGLELEIPIKGRLSIETGLMYKNHQVMSFDDDWEDKSGYVHNVRGFLSNERHSFLELPVRLTWNQHIHRKISTHIGFGPYVSYGFGHFAGNNGDKGGIEVGFQPSVSFYFWNFNIGASYNIPVYHNYHDKNKPAIMLTMGLRFKSGAWKYVGITALAVGTVGLGALAIAGMSKSSDTSSSGSSYSSGSGSSSSGGGTFTCTVCNGTGICKTCRGTGVVATAKDGKCGVCEPKGSGKCAACRGKGYLKKNN